MEICDNRLHGEIVHDERHCPACEKIDELTEEIKDLNKELDKANQQIEDLKEQI